jgi:hypothetical protein
MKQETYRYSAQKKAKLTPAGKTSLDELPVHGELLIFAERSVEVQSETIQPDEVRRNPARHLIEAGWRWQRAGNAMHKSWDNTSLGRLTLSDGTLKLESIRPRAQSVPCPWWNACWLGPRATE